jgi:hypothetical protein
MVLALQPSSTACSAVWEPAMKEQDDQREGEIYPQTAFSDIRLLRKMLV